MKNRGQCPRVLASLQTAVLSTTPRRPGASNIFVVLQEAALRGAGDPICPVHSQALET